MLKIIYKGIETTLRDSEFLTSGGQGDIYLKNGLIFKIYNTATSNETFEKLKELMILDKQNIIKPIDLVFDIKSRPIGYTMSYVDGAESLPLLFTSSFITRNNIDLKMTKELIKNMAETIEFIHGKDILLVDGNELNYLVDKKTFTKPYFLDVDSYQTKRFPATVIMPSIRDFKSKTFNKETDWYSFGVISFQLWTGIHPYKGKHQSFKNIEERCKNNISVFNKDVSYPNSVRDFKNIPKGYLEWYENVFEKGMRIPPPSIDDVVQVRIIKNINPADFIINLEHIFEESEVIKSVKYINGNFIITTDKSIWLNKRKFPKEKGSEIVYTQEGMYEVFVVGKKLHLKNITKQITEIDTSKLVDRFFVIDGRLYIIYESVLMELEIRKIGENIHSVVKFSQQISPTSMKIFSNVIYADLLGKSFFYIPFESGKMNVFKFSILDRCKIHDAKFENGMLTVCATDLKGETGIYRIRPDKDYQYFETDIQEINSTTLSNGVNVLFDTAKDEIYVMNVNDKQTGFSIQQRIINNVNLPDSSQLINNGTAVLFFHKNMLNNLKMK